MRYFFGLVCNAHQKKAYLISYADGKTGTGFVYSSPTQESQPGPLVIFVHGYTHLKTFDSRVVELTRWGFDVLAIDRTRLANERALLSCIRTGLMLLVSGISLLKLFEGVLVMEVLGAVLIPAGILTAVLGLRRAAVSDDGLAALEGKTPEEIGEVSAPNLIDVPWVEPEDVANAVVYLCTEYAAMIHGQTIVVDGGYSVV